MDDKRRKFVKKGMVILCSTPVLGLLKNCSAGKKFIFTICQNQCTGCGDCLEACEEKAIILPDISSYKIDVSSCDICGECEKVCQEQAIKLSYSTYNIDEENCIGCGDCLEVCQDEAKAISWEREYYTVRGRCKSDRCNHQCIAACQYDAITIVSGQASIDTEKCTRCGECVSVCPYDAINPAKVLLDQSSCIHCGKCFDVCKYEAITKTAPGDFHDPYIDDSLCTRCGNCLPVCPNNSITATLYKAYINEDKCSGCGDCQDFCKFDAISKI